MIRIPCFPDGKQVSHERGSCGQNIVKTKLEESVASAAHFLHIFHACTYIVINENANGWIKEVKRMGAAETLFPLLPSEIKKRLEGWEKELDHLEEIRFRVGRELTFCGNGSIRWLSHKGGFQPVRQGSYRVTGKDLELFLAACSEYSLYAYQDQIASGFLTIRGGHRIGFAGSLLMENGRINGFSDFGSINLRIAHEVTGCAVPVFRKLFDRERFCNTLILSPPGRGKTTLMRDLIRLLSGGSEFRSGCAVSVSDERGELAACYRGIPQMDLGWNTDVLDGGRKDQNLWLLIRTMNPEILAMDEIGGETEMQLLETASTWGIGLLATMHGTLRTLTRSQGTWMGMLERFVEPVPVSGSWNYRVYSREGNECL